MKTFPTLAVAIFLGGATLAAPALAQDGAVEAQELTPTSFDDAVLRAARELFDNVVLPDGSGYRYDLVIDPLIDGKTGARTVSTERMGDRIAALVRQKYPRFEVQPFSTVALDRKPLLLIGTLTPTNAAGEDDGPKDAYSVWLKIADLSNNTILSMGHTLSTPRSVNMTPTQSFAESPAWTDDPAIQGYIRSCQKTKPGEKLDQAYVDQLRSAALIQDAVLAYDAGRYEDSLKLYKAAANTAGGDQLRVHNGAYLANWKLGRTRDAAAAFREVVDYSLRQDRLAVKFLFEVGSTDFFARSGTADAYPMWLEQIAGEASRDKICLQLVGHTSPTGTEAFNTELSLRRAERIRDLLVADAPDLGGKIAAKGVGWAEPIVGTGADNASDALDRRVEFKVAEAC
jgi:outer membrane protein OmpA-like peptidoglycan-associated protein